MIRCLPNEMIKNRGEEHRILTEAIFDYEILEFLADENGGSTSDVADAADCEQPTADRRLNDLEEGDKASSRKIGRSLFYEVHDDRL